MGNIFDLRHENDEALTTGSHAELDCDCPVCGGIGVLLGTLGSATWLRCQDCGMDFRARVPVEPLDFTGAVA